MPKMTKRRKAILALGCLLAIGAGATAYFIRSASSEASDSSSKWTMIAVAGLVLAGASVGRRRREKGK